MLGNRLQYQIDLARSEVFNDPASRLSVTRKLAIYDALLDNPDMLMLNLAQGEEAAIPTALRESGGMKKLLYLGLLTTQKAFEVWERDEERFAHQTGMPSDWDPLPYIIHRVTILSIQGVQVGQRIVKDDKRLFDIPFWHSNLGNITEEVKYTQSEAVSAIYSLNALAMGYMPYYRIGPLAPELYDDPHIPDSCDFLYHTFEAVAHHDPNPPGLDAERTQAVTLVPESAHTFWRWWFDEALPQAHAISPTAVNWGAFERTKYDHLLIDVADLPVPEDQEW